MRSLKKLFCAGLVGLLVAGPASAITAAELADLLDDGAPVTVIDVRDRAFFKQGHIPNAINIPARVLPRKNLPPLGRVVVYGRGLGQEDMDAACDALNAKPGIQAEVLEGGYAAWQMAKGITTQAPGLRKGDDVNVVTYQGLKDMHVSDADVVFVDLRSPPPLGRQGGGEAPRKVAIEDKFPGKKVVKSPFDVPGVPGSGKLRRQDGSPLPLMVLIDDGDGKARETARLLRANGVRRVVVLAGGERILERDGKPGLQRIGMGATEVEE